MSEWLKEHAWKTCPFRFSGRIERIAHRELVAVTVRSTCGGGVGSDLSAGWPARVADSTAPGTVFGTTHKIPTPCDLVCDVTPSRYERVPRSTGSDAGDTDHAKVIEDRDLHRLRSPPVDLASYYYEPGGRRFESCRARHPLRGWLAPAVFSHAGPRVRSVRAWTSPAGRGLQVTSRLALLGDPVIESCTCRSQSAAPDVFRIRCSGGALWRLEPASERSSRRRSSFPQRPTGRTRAEPRPRL